MRTSVVVHHHIVIMTQTCHLDICWIVRTGHNADCTIYDLIHSLQNRCPHMDDTGSTRGSRHIGHSTSSIFLITRSLAPSISFSALLLSMTELDVGILGTTMRGLKIDQYIYPMTKYDTSKSTLYNALTSLLLRRWLPYL